MQKKIYIQRKRREEKNSIIINNKKIKLIDFLSLRI